MESGLDPFAPMVFKEGETTLPLNPHNQETLVPFYVSSNAVFKFAIDADSITQQLEKRIMFRREIGRAHV